ncbi:MAG TPA: maleylpyruvate isomerase N-terminal domain-containing protein [Candidatus Limnocylindria bacterium]
MPVAKVTHTKRRTMARVAAEYRALDRVVRALGTRGLERPVPGFGARARIRRESWTGKDALAHIVEWKRQALRALRREHSDPELRGLVIARKNRVLYERWHRRPARDVIAYHRAVERDVMAALRALPEDYFAKKRSPYWPGDLLGHAAGHRTRHLERML